MPRLDDCHEQVVRALEKEGWVVDRQPQRLISEARTVFIDIRAARQANGKGEQILLAEVKCFPDKEDTTARELYAAIGQYIVYRTMMDERNIGIPLYLAVPYDVYRDIFDSTIQHVISDNRIRLVLVDLDKEVIIEWKA